MKAIYLDNNATAPLAPAAWEAMQPYFTGPFGNPASSHVFGRRARQALENAREQIAALLDAQSDEVLFTSGATEANNLAIFGLVRDAPGYVVSSAVEHPSVLEPLRQLESRNFTLNLIPVDSSGCLALDGFALDADIRLATVMLANHETGAIQPVAEVARQLEGRAPLHCDAAAAAGKTPISIRALGVTALTVSAHKFHGPAGVGALLIRRNAKLRPLLFGGHQQQAKRPGTEPVALAVGMAAALAWSLDNLERHRLHLFELRRRFLDYLRQQAAPVLLNGPEPDRGLPHALNLSFPGCRADALLMSLDLAGVACATGSACSSGSLLPSPVLIAMGTSKDALHSALRFSLSAMLTAEEIDEAARRIADCVRRVRQKSQADD